MAQASIGTQELRVLEFITDHGPCTVREVADTLGKESGVVRTTILQVMERLRKKGHLVRVKEDGAFRYSATHEKATVVQGVVSQFVKNALGGSLSPLLHFLNDSTDLTPEDIEELQKIVDKLKERPQP